MNILYIGPYRQIDYVGQMSNLHIESIQKSKGQKNNLITRPLYLDYKLSDNYSQTYSTETVGENAIDMIVQYVPIDFIAILPTVKTVIIPMIDPKLQNISQDYSYDILNSTNQILVDDDKQRSLLRRYNLTVPIDIYAEYLVQNSPQSFNLHTEGESYSFGFIGDFNSNRQIIKKIIQAFLLCNRSNPDTSLYFFIRGSDNDKEEIDKTISDIQQDLKIPKYISPITTIFGLWNKDECLTALNSINCYMSLNDDYRYSLYEKFFMESNPSKNKYLISRSNTDSVEVPISIINNSCEYLNTFNAIHTQDLYLKMIAAISSPPQKYKKNESSSLGNILCKQAL